jgi:hypothetical protein
MKAHRRRALLLVSAAVIVLGAAGIAYATGLAFVGDDGVIQACANSANGNLRVLDPASNKAHLKKCTNGETAISWSQGGSSNGVSGYEVVAVTSPGKVGNATVSATCPDGKLPVGGGVKNSDPANFAWLDSYPNGPSWTVRTFQQSYNPQVTMTVYAICVNS